MNAYGAKAQVTRYSSDMFGISFRPKQPLFPNPQFYGTGQFSGSLPMSVADARRIKPNVKLLLVCKLSSPWYRNTVHTREATLDSPTETFNSVNLLEVVPEQLWVINSQTG